MGTQTSPAGQSQDKLSAYDSMEWHDIADLLAKKEYERVAAILQKRLAACESDNDPCITAVLSTAYQLCASCRQFQAVWERHRQAYEHAIESEQALQTQLAGLLETLSSDLSSKTWQSDVGSEQNLPDKVPIQSGRNSNLWQRVKRLLGQKSSPSIQNRLIRRRHSASQLKLHVDKIAKSTNLPQIFEGEGPEKNGPRFVIYCLGPFRVYINDVLITEWNGWKGQSIFKYLIAHSKQAVSKDILMDIFWFEADIESARNNLNVAIYNLRTAFRSVYPNFNHLLLENGAYFLNPALELWIDFEEFIRYYNEGRAYEKQNKIGDAIKKFEVAESLYEADLFPSDLYEDWLVPPREGLKDIYLIIINRLSQFYLETGQYAACIHYCQKILGKDDCREDAHRRLMRCYSYLGQRNLALRQYHFCQESLAAALDVTPMPETTAVYRKIRNNNIIQEL